MQLSIFIGLVCMLYVLPFLIDWATLCQDPTALDAAEDAAREQSPKFWSLYESMSFPQRLLTLAVVMLAKLWALWLLAGWISEVWWP